MVWDGVCGALATGAVDAARWVPEALATAAAACARAAVEPATSGVATGPPVASGGVLALGVLLAVVGRVRGRS
jgi:hypothetical protein